MHDNGTLAALSAAVAMAAGVVAQALARHLSIPGIVLLLATGVLLGPEFVGVVDPAALGDALPALVGFAVAIILFEGGMSLDVRRIARRRGPIRLLVTVGALITTVGGALCARYLLGWSWRTSILFGTLVIVTGPTVVTPLLRRIRVKSSVATVLQAEGIFGDAVGATVAVVALEVAIGSSELGIEGLGDSCRRDWRTC
jgi:NhaP-type Na+/H+ or K+/H+ antiporter